MQDTINYFLHNFIIVLLYRNACMQSLTFLNTREIKQLREPIIEQFGYFPEGNYAFLRSENDRLFIVSKDIARLNLQHLSAREIEVLKEVAEIKRKESPLWGMG